MSRRCLQQHCQECHRAGGGAPFTLGEYTHVYQRRDKLLESVEKRRMPPWKAVAGYGDLAGERRMSDGRDRDDRALGRRRRGRG